MKVEVNEIVLWVVIITTLIIFSLICRKIYKIGYKAGGRMVLEQWRQHNYESGDE